MKAKKREHAKSAAPHAPSAPSAFPWTWAAAVAASLCVLFWAYGPVLHGPFVFDDASLPFSLPNFSPALKAWVMGPRGLLMFTYWVNAQIDHDDPYSYHVLSVLIHALATALVFLIVRKLLEWSKSEPSLRNLLAGFAAAVFLLHPAQTEAVAYIAGRSESLSAMFFFAALTVFLYRRAPAIRWIESAAVLLLFLAALLSKEQTMVLPAVLLLTDYWWNPGFSFSGIRGNWRVYVPVILGALTGLAIVWRVLLSAQTAGFQLKDLLWYQYLFTECRALFVYVGIFLFPANLTADWDFSISHTLFEHGAIIGLAAWIALAALAWFYRRRFPLAGYGFFLYLLLMSPTSSILPIQDPVAERRLYFSMIGLLLIVVDFLGRLKVGRRALVSAFAAITLVAAIATHARAEVWADPMRLWEDTAHKSPEKFRAHFQLGYAYYEQQQFGPAVEEFQKADRMPARDIRERDNLLVDWALSLDGLGRPAEAIDKLREAALAEPTAHVYSQIGMIYAKQSQFAPALEALDQAQKLDPGFAVTYVYRGKIFELTNNPAGAVQQFQRALELDPANDQARQELLRLQRLSPGGRGQ